MTTIDLMAALRASFKQNDAIPPANAIEVIEKHHDLLGCRINGHEWRRLDPNEASVTPDAEFVCSECASYGQLVRPHGVSYP